MAEEEDLQSKLQFLQNQVKELESENAKLSSMLSKCTCHKQKDASGGESERASNPEVLSDLLLSSTVKVGRLNSLGELKAYWSGFIVGKVGLLLIILTVIEDDKVATDLRHRKLHIGFHDSVYPNGVSGSPISCDHEVCSLESRILLLIAQPPAELKYKILNFVPKEEWGLIYSQKIWAVSHPTVILDWELTDGIVSHPRFINKLFPWCDPNMIMFHHDLMVYSSSAGAAIVDKMGRVRGMHLTQLLHKFRVMSGAPLDAALRLKRASSQNVLNMQGDVSVNGGELNFKQEHVERIESVPCGISQAIHLEYIDKTLRNHFSYPGTEDLPLIELIKRFVMEKHPGSSSST